jgi:hypothetical protein
MSISSFLIRIILLVIPGIIGSLLYRSLRGRTSRKDWEDYLEILVFSFLAYGVYGLLIRLFNAGDALVTFRAFTNESVPIDKPIGHAILFASIAAVPIAFIASYIDNYKLINKFARRIKATRRFGDEDVWDYFNRSPDIKWVNVRDHKLNLLYACWIQSYSDPYKDRELLLRNVKVYNNTTGEFFYNTDVMYLSRKSDELTIEALISSNESVGKLEEKAPEVFDEDNKH